MAYPENSKIRQPRCFEIYHLFWELMGQHMQIDMGKWSKICMKMQFNNTKPTQIKPKIYIAILIFMYVYVYILESVCAKNEEFSQLNI